MSGKENPISEVTHIFKQAIYGIEDSRIDGISSIASRAVDKIRNNGLLLAGASFNPDIPIVSGFDMYKVSPDPRPGYAAALLVDVGRTLVSSPQIVMGDLIRTLAVLDQYPLNGYQRRYRSVYDDALNTQTQWLAATNSPELPLDPRTTDRELLLKTLLGEAKYYSDVGFDDWQKAIEGFKDSGIDKNAASMLDRLKDAPDQFLVMRQRFLTSNYNIAKKIMGDDFIIKYDDDQRAEKMAYNLMGVSVYARTREN